MSLVGFDTLLAQHPDRAAAISRLQDQIVNTLRANPHSVIDDRILSQQVHANIDFVRELLVELVALYVLQVRLFWLCPNGKGTVLDESSIERFPLRTECDRCGGEHTFRQADVDVRFVPSDRLLDNLHLSR